MAKLPAVAIGGRRSGTIASFEDAPSTRGYGDEIKLGGNWEAEGVGVFYLPIIQADKFAAAGIVRFGRLVDGRPTYELVYQARIAVVRMSTTEYTVFPIDDAGNAQVLPSQAVEVPAPVAPALQAPLAPPVARPGAVPFPSSSYEHVPHPADVDIEEDGRSPRDLWQGVDEQYAAALAIVAHRLIEIRRLLIERKLMPLPDVTTQDILAGAEVLLRTSAGELRPYPGLVRGLQERITKHETNGRQK